MSAADVRRAFLEFFRERGHAVVASSPLVPGNDPTLLFTNAGMVQFKDMFLGKEKRDYVRAASSQRCVRAGGKHNDLENVGYTARHHTFFEMLGNFSFGDYFKRDAIRYAWDFVTGTLKLDPNRLWVTVYQDDDEAADLWIKEIGVPADRVTRLGEKSNFWAMGDTGPCGPCSEIFYDHGAHIPGGPPGSPDEDGDRYVEIWNLVFMQYERSAEGTLTPLPKPSVDTGAGLERLSAVMQGVQNNYDIDLFKNLVGAAAQLAGMSDTRNPSLRVIADHIRACSFLIIDGVLPSNEGRGYVLRRIIRRALRHGHKLGVTEPFFFKLVAPLDAEMGAAYPELTKQRARVEQVLAAEEQRFAETLSQGMALLDAAIAQLAPGQVKIPGDTVFKLYDTYGFPVDLTADVARERDLVIDQAGFEAAMEAQRERARAASKFGVDLRGGTRYDTRTEFCGYDGTSGEGRVVALLREGVEVEALAAGERGEIVLDATPFYAESGGQVGDAGELSGAGLRFIVEDTQKRGAAHSHIGKLVEGHVRVGDALTARVDAKLRRATALNHSATHLLHAALRAVLGPHVAQKGSRVAPDRLRFDFSHHQSVSGEELRAIERLVNEQIRANAAAETRLMNYDDAVAAGVRRIEAVTGEGAFDYVESADSTLRDIASLVRGGRDDVAAKVRDALERIRQLEKENRSLKDKLASGQGRDLADGASEVGGVKVVATTVEGADASALRSAVDQLKDRLKSAVVVLASVEPSGKILLVAGVTADQTGRLKAGEIVGAVAAQVGGRGGGRPDFAQAGGTDASGLPAALAGVEPFIRSKLGL